MQNKLLVGKLFLSENILDSIQWEAIKLEWNGINFQLQFTKWPLYFNVLTSLFSHF